MTSFCARVILNPNQLTSRINPGLHVCIFINEEIEYTQCIFQLANNNFHLNIVKFLGRSPVCPKTFIVSAADTTVYPYKEISHIKGFQIWHKKRDFALVSILGLFLPLYKFHKSINFKLQCNVRILATLQKWNAQAFN